MRLPHIKKNKNIVIGFLVVVILLFLGGLFIFLYIGSTERNYIIELRDDGFYPKELVINKGDIVTFKTNRDSLFWPASNLHPFHTVYPEFDSNEPIQPNGKWSFRFDKEGQWKYHDHLNSAFIATIIVEDGKKVTDCVRLSQLAIKNAKPSGAK